MRKWGRFISRRTVGMATMDVIEDGDYPSSRAGGTSHGKSIRPRTFMDPEAWDAFYFVIL